MQSNLSVHDQLMQLPEFRWHLHLEKYVPPLLLLIGTVGNVLSFCVLMRRSMRVTSTYNYLAVLSLLDTLVLYTGPLRKWLIRLTGMNLANEHDWACKLITMLVYTVTVSSVWLLIAVTVDRYIATVHGIHAMSMCTQRRAIRVIAGVIVFFSVLHVHFLWTMGLRQYTDFTSCASAEGYEYFVQKVWPWVDGVLYCFAPFAIILALNTRIIVQVLRSRRSRQQASNGEVTPLSSHRSSTTSIKVTLMLLVISFTFLLCTLPMAVVMICRAFLAYDAVTVQQIATFRLASTVSQLLTYVNHSINFYLYLLSGHRFRQELLCMLRRCCCCCCCCRRNVQHPRNAHRLLYSTTFRKNSDVTTTMVTLRADSGITVM